VTEPGRASGHEFFGKTGWWKEQEEIVEDLE